MNHPEPEPTCFNCVCWMFAQLRVMDCDEMAQIISRIEIQNNEYIIVNVKLKQCFFFKFQKKKYFKIHIYFSK